jgi:hypothetical protein
MLYYKRVDLVTCLSNCGIMYTINVSAFVLDYVSRKVDLKKSSLIFDYQRSDVFQMVPVKLLENSTIRFAYTFLCRRTSVLKYQRKALWNIFS